MKNKLNSYFWYIFLPSHILFFAALAFAKYSFSFWLITFLFWVLISGYGIGVGFHRLLSHKSFQTYPLFEIVLSYLGCLGIQGSPIFWVNLHRGYHHPHADTDKDPHTPKKGFWWAYLLWPIMIDYREIRYAFVSDLFRKKFQIFLHKSYFFILIATWFVLLFSSTQLFFAFIFAQILTLHQEFCVNLFCHSGRGYRNFETPDQSVNRYLLGLVFWGVGFHNNHHAYPNRYNFAVKKYEFDPTIVLVGLIKKT